jgi:hypothetical protein
MLQGSKVPRAGYVKSHLVLAVKSSEDDILHAKNYSYASVQVNWANVMNRLANHIRETTSSAAICSGITTGGYIRHDRCPRYYSIYTLLSIDLFLQ